MSPKGKRSGGGGPRLSDSSSSSSSSSSSNDDESEEESSEKKKLTQSVVVSKANNSNKKVKYSSDEESGSQEEEEEGADSDDDYDDSEDSNDEDESEDESTDIDDSNDSDYNFGSRRKKKKKSKKAITAKKSKKPLAAAKSSNSRVKQATSNSSRYKTSSRATKSAQSAASSATAQNKSSYERRATARKVVNYCEDNSDESEEDEMDDDVDEDDMGSSGDEPVVKKSSSKSAGARHHHHHTPEHGLGGAVGAVNENVETLERVLKARRGVVGATGSKTAIYNVEELGDPNKTLLDSTIKEEGEEEEEVKYEDQYLIKWLGWSHLHNTWESKESLTAQKVNGMKKLENFLKKEEEVRVSKVETNMSPEDIEYYECQKEMMDNLLETHQILERVIASKNTAAGSGGTPDYLCKWQGLPYSECTWEDGELIKKRFGAEVANFEQRQSVQTLAPVNVKSQKAMRIRPRFVALKEQPEYLGASDPECKLRDYQLDGLNWLANSWCKQNGVILADEMGLGKTIQSISFISYVFNEHNLYGPFLVVIPLSTIQGWQREFQKWSPEINVVLYLGDMSSRAMIQQYELYAENQQRKFKANVILTTYEILLKDKSFFNSIAWAALIVDEAHRLKNEDSLLYRTLVRFDTNHRMLITGTPLQNSLRELWALLNFIMPERFDNWEEFDSKYSQVLSDGLRFQDLHKELQPYLLRRVKKDVEKSLPAKVEQILRVEMTTIQKQYYKLILTKNYKELAKGAKGNVNTFLNLMMELKKCSNHAFLIRRDDGTGDTVEQLIKGSGKLLLLDKLLRRLKETGHRVLIFSQMVRMLDIIAEYLRFRRFPFQRLDGSIKGEIRRQALDHFNKEDSDDFCFLLSTRAGGLGINLATADTVIIYDSDWNPQNDLQAQARAHRIGQKNQVNIYRLVSKNSIEEDIVERAKQKMVLDHLVIQRMDTTGRTVLNKSSHSSSIPFNKDEINSILKFGAEELFKDSTATTSNNNGHEEENNQLYDIDEILKRAETREETNCLSATEELLSQFKVANFSTMEDEPIIFPSSTAATTVNEIVDQAGAVRRKELDEKSWLDIIPESERRQIDVEEEDARLRMIHLTTLEGRRRTINNNKPVKQQNQASDDDDDDAYKSGQDADDNSDSSGSEHRGGGKKGSKSNKKSGSRGGGGNEHVVKGLNAQEVRRFVRSYRKFPSPLTHIDTIAQDANLEEKSQAILIEFAQKLQQLCKTSISEFEAKGETENDKKKRGPELEINGVKMYAQQVLETETYFEPLTYFYEKQHKLGGGGGNQSSDGSEFQFKTKLKQTYWDCEWSEEDDKALLRGIYEHGYGNWEWIKTDPALKLENKILMMMVTDNSGNGDAKTTSSGRGGGGGAKSAGGSNNTGIKLKPQSKHLRTRIDYLIKVLQNQMNVERYGANWKSLIETPTPHSRTSQQQNHNSSSSARGSSNNKRQDNTDENSNGETTTTTTPSVKSTNRKRHAQEESGGKAVRRKLKQASNETVMDNSNDSDQSEQPSAAATESKKKKPNPRGEDSENSDTAADTTLTTTATHKRHNKHHESLNIARETSNALTALSGSLGGGGAGTNLTNSTQSNPSGVNNSLTTTKEKKILLDEKTFEECKNILRPVKRALKDINIIESSNALTDKTHLDQVRRLVLDIGDKINDHLASYSDLEKINKWRNYLWAFVAKFTTSWNFERIKNLYKKFAKNRDDEQLNNNTYQSSYGGGSSTTTSSSGYRYKSDDHSSNKQHYTGQYDSSRSKKPHFDNNRYKEKSNNSSSGSGGGGGSTRSSSHTTYASGSGSGRREFHQSSHGGGGGGSYRHNVNNDNSHDGGGSSYSSRMMIDSTSTPNDRKPPPRFQSHHSGESLQWSPGGGGGASDEYRKFNRSYRSSGNVVDDYYHQQQPQQHQYASPYGGYHHHHQKHYPSGSHHYSSKNHPSSSTSSSSGPPPPPPPPPSSTT